MNLFNLFWESLKVGDISIVEIRDGPLMISKAVDVSILDPLGLSSTVLLFFVKDEFAFF